LRAQSQGITPHPRCLLPFPLHAGFSGSYLFVIPLPSLICPRGFGRKQRKDYILFAMNRSYRKFRGLHGLREQGDDASAMRCAPYRTFALHRVLRPAETSRVERSSEELFGQGEPTGEAGGGGSRWTRSRFYLNYIFCFSVLSSPPSPLLSLALFFLRRNESPRNCIHLPRVRAHRGGREGERGRHRYTIRVTRKILLIGYQTFFPVREFVAYRSLMAIA